MSRRGLRAPGPANIPSASTTTAQPNRFQLRAPHLLYYSALLLAAVLFLVIRPITDADFWYHLAFGRTVLDTGSLPRTDLLSHTAVGRPWISSGWLPAILLEVLYRRLGPAGPLALTYLSVTAAALLTLFVSARRYANAGSVILLLLLGLVVAYPRFNPRPDLFSQFMIVPLILLLISTESESLGRFPSRQRRLWFLPLIIVVWANLHALFVVGLAIVGLYGAWRLLLYVRTRDRLHAEALVPCALCFLVWSLNPYGTGYIAFIRDNASLPGIRRWIYELKPYITTESVQGGIPVHHFLATGALLLVSFTILTRTRTKVPLWRWAVALLVTLLAFWQRRHVGLLGAALPALLLPNLAALDGRLARHRFLLPVIVTATVLAVCGGRMTGLLQMPSGLPTAAVDCRWFPCRSTDFLRRYPPPSNLFNDLTTGGFLAYHLGPQTKVFIDGRNEVYKGAPWNDFFAPPEGRGTFDEVFSKYGVNTAVLDARAAFDHPGHAVNQLSENPQWVLVQFDESFAVFVRETAETQAYLQEHGLRYANPFNMRLLAEAIANPSTRAAALAQVERTFELSGGSSRSHLLAYAAALQTGNSAIAEQHLAAARRIDPSLAVAMNSSPVASGPPR